MNRLDITIIREPYLGRFREVLLHLPDGSVRGRLLTPEQIWHMLRLCDDSTFVTFVTFVGHGGRNPRTFRRPRQE